MDKWRVVSDESSYAPLTTHHSPITTYLFELADEARCCFGDEIACQLDRLFAISANRLHGLQQIAAIAGTRAAAAVVVTFVQIIDGFGTVIHAESAHDGGEDLLVDIARRRVDADFMADTSQEGVVHQVFRIEVRRKDRQLLEGDFEFLAGREVQEVVAVLERHDPAVE